MFKEHLEVFTRNAANEKKIKEKRNSRERCTQLANALKIMKMQTIKEQGGCDETNKSYVMTYENEFLSL